jgi:hypothetical protein
MFELPSDYQLLREIDLQKDQKSMLLVNGLSLLIGAVLAVLGWALQRPQIPAEFPKLLGMAFGVLCGCAAYLVLHEWVHGIFIKRYCGQKAEYKFTGMYACAGKKDAYFFKKQYIIIALAPVILWGIVLLGLNMITWQKGVFWPVYLIQLMNLSGAAGDFYVVAALSHLPAETLCNDDGASMRFYIPKGAVQ